MSAAAVDALNAASTAAMERAFEDGHFALLSLAGALRADAAFVAEATHRIAEVMGAVGPAFAVVVAAMALWFIGFEASSGHATPGKRLLGLRVETLDGERPSLARRCQDGRAPLCSRRGWPASRCWRGSLG